MSKPTSKTLSKTYRLHRNCIDNIELLVKAGRAETQTALLEMLVSREKARYDMEREEEELDRAWALAMESSEYCAEMKAIQSDFASSDAETARRIP
ncbi:MAG: hypothetical protein KF760_20140 [Candidatus Eremiobacteraeota bacterium]|nr:hypothetical protein [Candidatus Eremiobacteraeota bacterium]MCW5868171.1 hypothetical protein [Candidatus Eremiobacteraeota bacterium]